MRILLIFPGHGISTIDVAKGYEAALRELGHEVFAYNYHNSLLFHRIALDAWKNENPAFEFSKADWLRLSSDMAIIEAVRFVPEVVIVVCGFVLDRQTYQLFNNLRLPMVMILTESPYLDDEQATLMQWANARLTFTNEQRSVPYLSDFGPTCYLPHSYDPARHKPMRVNGEHQSDVFFCGTMYEERSAIFDAVNWDGIDARIVGPVIDDREVKGGMVSEELIKHYNGTKIALNMHRTSMGVFDNRITHIEDGAAWSLGPRAFEVAGCGVFQLCDDSRGELQEVFGATVPTFRNSLELELLVRGYLADDAARQEVAALQHERVAPCTFLNRAQEILLPAIEEVL